MLSKSLDVVDHEEWIAEFGEALANQIPMYNRYSEEKVRTCVCATLYIEN
jgi:hypothetical protein